MKRILLPTDFSKNAWNAIIYALHFLRDEDCVFYLLNTYTPVIYRVDYLIGGPAVSAIPDIGIDVSLAGLERTVEKIEKDYPNTKHQFKTVSEFNTLTDEVDKVCKKEGVHMIIMGTKGASGVKEVFMGSNAVHVIRKSKVPVLAIPEDHEFKPLNSILFPTDYLNQYDQGQMAPLMEIINRFDAKLHIVHVEEDELSEVQNENKKHLIEMVKEIPSVFEDITDDYMPNIVHSYVEKNKIDLIAMINRKHTFLQRLLYKPNIDAVGYQSIVPFLVIPETLEH